MSNKISRTAGIILGVPRPKIVRNVSTGNILLCLYRDCERPGSDDIRIEAKPAGPLRQAEPIKIFCSNVHRELYLQDALRREINT